MSSAENRTRFCTVSISASLTLPSARSATVIQPVSSDNHQTAGMRLEYSWAPQMSPDSVRKMPTLNYQENVEGNSVLAASFTLNASPFHRPILPYERRCRSTCSITLQEVPPSPLIPPSASPQNYSALHHPRRNSVGGSWESHELMTATGRSSGGVPFGGPRLASTDTPPPPQARASSVDKVTGRENQKSRKKNPRTRPRSVHIDVYCTASDSGDESDSLESGENVDSSDESNTSTCYTVVRKPHVAKIRHIRKKKSLPLSIAPEAPSFQKKQKKKPVLSYRISAKELADALERDRLRDRRGDGEEQVEDEDQRLGEELFRDLTDYSGRSPGFWSDASEGSASLSSLADGLEEFHPEERNKTWRSPGDERERRERMLEQRKMQWRAAKEAEAERSARCNQLLSVPVVLRRSGSDRQVSRRNSQRCPPADEEQGPPIISVKVPAVFQAPPPPPLRDYRSASPIIPRLLSKKRESPVDIPWQFRRLEIAPQISTGTGAFIKKFGHHVGPARNPHCSCAHCVDHFSSNRSRQQQPQQQAGL